MLSSLIATVDSPTDKELITQLYNTYKQFMYNISMSLLGKREDAEDAVQDSFVRIIDNLDKINNPYSRKTKSYPFEDSYTNFENSNATYEQIIKNLKQLPPRLKNIAFLFFVQRLSPKEIGEMLDINTNTVYAYVSRIRKILLDTKDENI